MSPAVLIRFFTRICPLTGDKFRATFNGLALASLLVLSSFPAMAEETDPLAQMEQTILMETHTGEPLADRLSRLETFVFGEAQSGDPTSRQAKLLEIYQNTQAATPPPATPDATDREDPIPMAQPAYSPPPKPDATDYPTVTAMEKKVFGHDFRQEAIQTRLNRLEQNIFGKSYPDKELVDRVDGLLSKVPASAILNDSSPSAMADPSRVPGSGSQYAGGTPGGDIYLKLDTLERILLNGRNSSGKMITERLDILERASLGLTYAQESPDSRLNRLFNHIQNRISTGQSPAGRPAVQPRPGYSASPSQMPPSPYGNQSATPRQNIRIGSTIGSNSRSQFSQDMLNMLPDDVRAQMQGGGVSTGMSQGTVAMGMGGVTTSSQSTFNNGWGGTSTRNSTQTYTSSAPGTVIIQETREIPGYQNWYTPPGGIINPMVPGAGMPYMNQTMVDPAVAQLVGQLELRAYGQMNPYAPLPMRLNQLEASILGQNLSNWSTTDRLNNLQRAIQMQSLGQTLGNGRLGQVGRAAGSVLLGVPMNPPGVMAPGMMPQTMPGVMNPGMVPSLGPGMVPMLAPMTTR